MNEREKRDARESLYDDLANDRTTPNEAEDKARELGLEPLTPTLDPALFDPMREADWTLAMAVAWIAWADLERVRDCLPRWRRAHQSWYWRECREGDGAGGSRIRRGWLLEQTHKGEAPLLFRSLCEAFDASEGAPLDPALRYTINEANRLLWEKLGVGELTARTIFQAEPHVIPPHEWAFLRSGEHRDRDVLYLDRDSWQGPRYDSDVLLSRDAVLTLWPAAPAPAPVEAGAVLQGGPALGDLIVAAFDTLPSGLRASARNDAIRKAIAAQKLPPPCDTTIKNALSAHSRLRRRRVS